MAAPGGRLREWAKRLAFALVGWLLAMPTDSRFVMGDNRDLSYDGRFWGFLPRSRLHGGPQSIYSSYDPASWRAPPFLTAVPWGRLLTVPQ